MHSSVSTDNSCLFSYLHFRLHLSKVYSAAAGQTITLQHCKLMCPSKATVPQPKHPYGLDLRESPLPEYLQSVCVDERN